VPLAIVKETEMRGSGVRKILYGWLCDLADGTKVYLARRRHAEIFRSGRSSISGAMSENAAAWAIDQVMLFNLRAKGVSQIGVRVIDTGDVWLTDISSYFDRKKYKEHNYTGVGRGGSLQRYVPLQHFKLEAAPINLELSL